MPLILQLKWGSKTGNMYATTSKRQNTFYNWCKWWGSDNSDGKALKTRACLVHAPPRMLYEDVDIGMGFLGRWNLDRGKGCLQ